ncbi:MCE family protein [Nocardioides humilatus]|uniref:MCE family protein n=1 Tax=Nocardioides humilatus TaxID=2607660 RepID=A0A5B1LFB0_9ACTN|nr:MlaD family protein [Nocardioides humilatus]KAA1419342.1 MCE family protein [Nocardioides humilatus]
MISVRLRLQILAFAVIAAVGISYVGARYVGVPRLLGLSGYHVTVEMPRAGGLFVNAEVTYRGVPIGRVEEMTAAPDGVRAVVVVTSDVEIPRDVDAWVRNRSAIGEQYLDLRPAHAGGPMLADGDRTAVADDQLPIPLDGLMSDLVAFDESVPIGDLRRVVREISTATQGTGDDLRTLLEASSSLVDQAVDGFPATSSLIDASETVLRTQARRSDDIRAFSADLRLVADVLADAEGDIGDLISRGPGAARELGRLVTDVGTPLAGLFDELLSLNGVLASRRTELADVLGHAPQVVDAYSSALHDGFLSMGLIANVTDPVPCTNGYAATRRHDGLQTTDGPLRTDVRCRSRLVRGSGSAPHDEGWGR